VTRIAHELFLAADVRIAAQDAVFNQGEVTAASFPGGGATIRLMREAGWGNAMRYMLTGDGWNAEEAYRLGLVQELTPPGQQLDPRYRNRQEDRRCSAAGRARPPRLIAPCAR
jgi:enoyl-CoA hydratase/carnithine racemase